MIHHIDISKRDNPYVMMDKRALEDDTLTWRAKGLLAYLLSRPPDWKVLREDLINRSVDGRDSVQSGMKELASAGYAALIFDHGNGVTGGKRWVVAETKDMLLIAVGRENRSTVEPSDGFPVTTNNDSNKNEDTNNHLPLNNPSELNLGLPEEHTSRHREQSEMLYVAYPKKSDKLASLKAIEKALTKYDFEFLLRKVKAYGICKMGTNPDFLKKCCNFFRDGTFLDDVAQWTETPRAEYLRGKEQGKPVGIMSASDRRSARRETE